MEQKYSVLMSVYYREKKEYLRQSIESLMCQTILPDEVVIVCDGELTGELDAILKEYQTRYPKIIKLVRLKEHVGLGRALNAGLLKCKNEIVARMDSDDICFNNRMERELKILNDRQVTIVSGTVLEFEGSTENVVQRKILPETDREIKTYAKNRNPFNHPAAMFRRSKVLEVGGYQNFPMFEDYHLWVRLIGADACGYNIPEPLLYMRSGEEMYGRRGGIGYARKAVKFKTYMYRNGYCSFGSYCVGVFGRAAIALIPNKVRKIFYRKVLRK